MHLSDQATVNEHLPCVTNILISAGQGEMSRNGPVKALTEPICVTTRWPQMRVSLVPARKSNPFVDFFDGLFILAGTRNYRFLFDLHKRFEQYTEYDGHAHGQYSHRILKHFGFNQLHAAAYYLANDNATRRAVIQLWSPDADHHYSLQDVPCNLCALPRINPNGDLDLTVFNRSNDVYWGMLGVNIVQFSMLQEVLAYLVSVPIGYLRQISNNAHAYLEFGPYKSLRDSLESLQPETYSYSSVPMIMPTMNKTYEERIRIVNDWMRQLNKCWEMADFQPLADSEFVFLREVVLPMFLLAKHPDALTTCLDPNWQRAVEIYYGK